MNNDKKVVLIRKQSTPFTVNYPHDGIFTTYTWAGTQGQILNDRPVPFEVFEWLQNSTTTFSEGCLLIKETEDEDVTMIKENIINIDKVEESVMSKSEIMDMINSGNHLALKKKLNDLIKDMSDNIKENTKRYIIGVASEEGVDSSAKRKILCEWADIDYENNDLFFDKNLREIYDK
ncbi:TPA: hypothetical protein ACXDAY_002072 [Clostridium botulinum]|uniref:hypothetical protein n=1 Tax=Clostridium botulinum TaxID=1491 RepID=UPI000466D39A|nr:hypothetical protein [Clostridium botulinum]APR02569.1 hypothetical protein RSJ2_4117 [Clostridium botulinum]AUN01624.1 hypothetical protein RSJ19_01205 [Clostridium botulinum]MBN3359345.1 hypothetical protein [Clostridium botulinum]MBN3367174.1 hypothetical protein [Clostridium botulinum]MBN3371807.1 hypothetical protein [Clostridium botulinum]